MNKYIILSVIILIFNCCNFENPSRFSQDAYDDVLYSVSDEKETFKDIIDQYKGRKVLIDLWASWCADCIKGLPKIKNLQIEYPEVIFLFISVDKNKSSWKKGIARFKINGEHYNLPKGMSNGSFVNFVNLNWIPRYIVVDESGDISMFKATNALDKNIVKALKKVK